MKQKLIKLANKLSELSPSAAEEVYKIAARYDKLKLKYPIKSQPAYKYIMYFKLMRAAPDPVFHKMKRRYLDTSKHIQDECHKEFDSMILEDALKQKIPSSTIRKNFAKHLADFESNSWDQYFNTGSETRRG